MAAYKLWLGLRACARGPRNQEELEQQKNRLLETRMVGGMAANDEWISNHIRSLETVFPFCSSVPADVDARAAAYMWLTKAAESGFVTALLDYVSAVYMTEPAPPEVIPAGCESESAGARLKNSTAAVSGMAAVPVRKTETAVVAHSGRTAWCWHSIAPAWGEAWGLR